MTPGMGMRSGTRAGQGWAGRRVRAVPVRAAGVALATLVALAVVAIPAPVALAASRGYSDPLAGSHGRLPHGTKVLYLDGPARVQPVRPGFLGLSLEY